MPQFVPDFPGIPQSPKHPETVATYKGREKRLQLPPHTYLALLGQQNTEAGGPTTADAALQYRCTPPLCWDTGG